MTVNCSVCNINVTAKPYAALRGVVYCTAHYPGDINKIQVRVPKHVRMMQNPEETVLRHPKSKHDKLAKRMRKVITKGGEEKLMEALGIATSTVYVGHDAKKFVNKLAEEGIKSTLIHGTADDPHDELVVDEKDEKKALKIIEQYSIDEPPGLESNPRSYCPTCGGGMGNESVCRTCGGKMESYIPWQEGRTEMNPLSDNECPECGNEKQKDKELCNECIELIEQMKRGKYNKNSEEKIKYWNELTHFYDERAAREMTDILRKEGYKIRLRKVFDGLFSRVWKLYEGSPGKYGAHLTVAEYRKTHSEPNPFIEFDWPPRLPLSLRRKKANEDLVMVNKITYFAQIPLQTIFNLVKKHGLVPLQEDNTEWSGFLLGREGNMVLPLGDEKTAKPMYGELVYEPVNAGLFVSWYKMGSGNYEVVTYVS